MIALISNSIIPIMLLIVLIYATQKKINVYDAFTEGAKESFEMVLNLFPTFLAMILAVNIIVNSNLIYVVLNIIKPIFDIVKVPVEIIPMALIRPVSGSASLAILNNIFTTSGVDSITGKIASVIQGSTDTTVYVLTLYFGSIGIRKTRYALWAGLFADLIGIVSSIIIVKLLF